ncbi:L-histidine N(alpha)-methyltransferase [Segetibacter aerophilus]|uniref:Dimethylhistidine N-methyltransferase n=1 Tax=Segetibacter aerophilus TaxID=670293 RepID=A0A512BBU8_9BACT|nr:L-histidine N(alpha)-methyltransferase [Segetibacter aerophilus]GEO09375.1 dimethylhistidine N-methyltransferase [Segetibacter aerophilus]
MSQFLEDVLKGLSAKEKYLQSKYFYDANGDKLFQSIMGSKEYYPTKCEMEIFTQKTSELVTVLTGQNKEFDIVELGAGDATKSVHLLKGLLDNKVTFTYFPVDISANVIDLLQNELPKKLPTLKLQGLNGEYFKMLEKAKTLSDKIKVVLFLGSNIGNVPLEKAGDFVTLLRQHLKPGDLVLIGFDLKKDPKTILDAYNDSCGFTRDFNLNLLRRINNELQGNFNLDNFYHYPTYDPATGATKSYIVSKVEQQVSVAENLFDFSEGESIFMEISQKYTVQQTDELAKQTGFEPIHHFYDTKKWFLDAIWRCV